MRIVSINRIKLNCSQLLGLKFKKYANFNYLQSWYSQDKNLNNVTYPYRYL